MCSLCAVRMAGMLSTAPNLEMYGRALLGVEGNITPLI
jgi:hypothetical protein